MTSFLMQPDISFDSLRHFVNGDNWLKNVYCLTMKTGYDLSLQRNKVAPRKCIAIVVQRFGKINSNFSDYFALQGVADQLLGAIKTNHHTAAHQ